MGAGRFWTVAAASASRHGSQGPRCVASLLAPPWDDEGEAVAPTTSVGDWRLLLARSSSRGKRRRSRARPRDPCRDLRHSPNPSARCLPALPRYRPVMTGCGCRYRHGMDPRVCAASLRSWLRPGMTKARRLRQPPALAIGGLLLARTPSQGLRLRFARLRPRMTKARRLRQPPALAIGGCSSRVRHPRASEGEAERDPGSHAAAFATAQTHRHVVFRRFHGIVRS